MADSLLCYDLEIRKKRDSNLRELFCFDNKNDLFDIARAWIMDLEDSKFVSPDFKRSIHREANSIIEFDGRCIVGLLRTSRTGTGSDILKGETLELKAHKDPEDLEAIDLLYLVHIPEKGRQGKLIVQNHDGLNASTCLRTFFIHRFEEEFSQFKIHIRPTVFTEIIDTYIRVGNVLALELKKRITTREEIDCLNPDSNRFANPYITITYKGDEKARYLKRTVIDKIHEIYKKKKDKKFINVEFDSSSITLEHQGKSRKLSLEALYSRVNIWPLSDNISLDTNRVPVYEEVKNEAKALIP